MVRIAEVSGQTPDREQQAPAGQFRKRSAAKPAPASEESDSVVLGPEPGEEEQQLPDPDLTPAPTRTAEPATDSSKRTTDSGIDLLA